MVRSPQVAGSLTGSIVMNSMYGEGVGQFAHSQLGQLGQNSVSTAGSGMFGQGHSHSQALSGNTGGKGSPVRGGLALEGQSFSSGYDANEVRTAIAERERNFFKEVSLNPNLKDQHPLMHLISAQQKLKLIDEQSGVLASKTANKSESIFGTRYGKQSADKFHKNGAYAAEIPYAINGEIILPSKLRQRKLEELKQSQVKKSKSLKMLLNPGSLVIGEQSGGDMSVGADTFSLKSTRSNDPNAKQSQRHRDFLQESLKRIEDATAASASYSGHYTGSLDDRAVAAAASSKSPFGVSPSGRTRSPSVRSVKGPPSSRSASSSPVPRSAGLQYGELDGAEPSGTSADTGEAANHLLEGSTESELMQRWGLNEGLQASGSLTEGSAERNLVSEQADLLLAPAAVV
jgi:hypothetical protein